MAPMESLAGRRMHIVFMWKPFRWLTASAAGRARKARGLVSWKKTTHFTPSSAHRFARPERWRSRWTSLCPWGLVASSHSPLSASFPVESLKQGTLSCFSRVTLSSMRPK